VFNNVTGTGEPQWISLHYTVNDPSGMFCLPGPTISILSKLADIFFRATAGEAHIFVNDQVIPTNISDMNSRAGYHKTIPVELELKPGEVNTIKFGAIGSAGMRTLSFIRLSCRLFCLFDA